MIYPAPMSKLLRLGHIGLYQDWVDGNPRRRPCAGTCAKHLYSHVPYSLGGWVPPFALSCGPSSSSWQHSPALILAALRNLQGYLRASLKPSIQVLLWPNWKACCSPNPSWTPSFSWFCPSLTQYPEHPSCCSSLFSWCPQEWYRFASNQQVSLWFWEK